MKRKQKIMTLAAAGLLTGLAIYGLCQLQNRQNHITLEFGMFTGSNWDVAQANGFTIIDKAIDKFEQTHPGVTVHYYSGIRKDDYSEWFSRKLLAGEEPDIFMVLGTDFNQFASMGVMKDLGSLMETDTDFDQEKYFTSAFVNGQYESVQYALPYETVPTLMFVNKTLLTQEGIDMPGEDWTWDDLYEICEKVTRDTDGDGVLDQFGTYNYDWMDALCSNGGGIFNKKGTEAELTDAKVIEAVKYVRSINELYNGEKISQEDFNGGRVAFMPLTFAEYRTYKTYPYKIRKYANFQWDCLTMPAGSRGGNISQVDSLLMGISANTKEEKLARKQARKAGKVGFGKLILWNSSSCSLALSTLMLGYATFYCTDVLQLAPALVGTLFMASKIFDSFTDLVAGFIVDRTQTRWGKGRPYEIFMLLRS